MYWQVHPDRMSTMFLAAMYNAWSKHSMLCRLCRWTESNFMVRNHSRAAVPGRNYDPWCKLRLFMLCSQPWILLLVSLVSCCHCFIKTLCLIKLWSPGHLVLQGAQETMHCNTGNRIFNEHIPIAHGNSILHPTWKTSLSPLPVLRMKKERDK